MRQTEPITYAYEGEKIDKCRACGAEIYFKIIIKKDGTKSKPIPVNRTNNQPHWGSCPAANKFRKS